MENEFVTIAQAAQLTGKSDIEIMRLIKDRLQTSGLPVESIMKKEQRERGAMYLIQKGFLLQELQHTNIPKEVALPKAVFEPALQEPVLEAKDEMISTLQKIIETKDKQMEDLSKKIDQLIERDRETNILLKGLQERMFLLEDKKTEPAKNQTRRWLRALH